MGTSLERTGVRKSITWSGSTDSNAITLDGQSAGLQLILPAAFTGTTLTYKTKTKAGTWIPVHKDGAAVEDTVAGSAATCNVLNVAGLFGLQDLKIVSDQTETCEGELICTG